MPNIITHTLFADDMLKALGEPDWLAERKQLMEVGSNGPDILFFEGLSPKRFFKTGKLPSIGNKLHASHVNAFYQSAIDSIRAESDPLIRQDMEAYAIGHLCHWALDSTMHPYVFYKTGDCSKGKSASRHHRMESLMDAIMLKVKKNVTIKEADISEVANCSMEQARAIARIYVPAIERIFGQEIKPHLIKNTLDDWCFMQRLFHDPKGGKISTLRKIEKVAGLKNQFSGFIVPNNTVDDYDVMNLLHKEWLNPATHERSTASVFELYSLALNKAQEVVHLFMEALQNPEKEKAFFDYLGDRNYEMDTTNDIPLTEFDIQEFDF